MASMPALVKKLPQEGDIRAVEQSMKLSINPSLVMMRECPCSTKTREVLGNPSPPPSRFSSAVGFAPLDPQDFPRASPSGNPSGLGVQNPRPRKISRISLDPRDFPRASPSGNSLGSREIGRRGWISQYLPRLGGARIHSLILSREGLILTLSILPCPQGWIS